MSAPVWTVDYLIELQRQIHDREHDGQDVSFAACNGCRWTLTPEGREEHERRSPRRIDIDRFHPTETAIYAAQQAVESVGADVLLTDAAILLDAARAKVAEYVDGTLRRQP